jgi:hypothetical protein
VHDLISESRDPAAAAFRRRMVVVGLVALAIAAVVAALALTRGGSRAADLRLARLAPAQATDVSRARGVQSEVAVALDPSNPRVAIAGSNDLPARAMRVYSTVDAGGHWRSRSLPLPSSSVCGTSDPSVAIAANGRQFYSFLGISCPGLRGPATRIYVSSRTPAGGAWRRPLVAAARSRSRVPFLDDRPSITVDNGVESPHRGRLYVGWTRFSQAPFDEWIDPDSDEVHLVDTSALLSYSDDGGRHWSKPAVLSRRGDPLEVRIAVARSGSVYATWRDARTNAVYVSSSANGRAFGRQELVAPSVVRPEQSCHTFRARIPAQPKRCVSPNPTIAVDTSAGPHSGRVYVVWGSTSLNQSQDVYVAAFDSELHPKLGVGAVHQVNPAEGFRGRDQFLPSAAVDAENGRLWVCYYLSIGKAGRSARFTCTMSNDGGEHWLRPIAATTVASNETHKPADVANGYGDYEGVAAAGGKALAAWTDGRDLRRRREEVYAIRLSARPAPK